MDAAVRGSSVGRARRGWSRPTGARGAVWPPPPRPSARQHHHLRPLGSLRAHLPPRRTLTCPPQHGGCLPSCTGQGWGPRSGQA